MSGATRQRAYRARSRESGKHHLQVWIDPAAAQSLADAATAAGQTQADYLEHLLTKEKPMKTMQDWTAAGICLSRFLDIGDRVDDALLAYVRDVMPPAYEAHGWLAMGEPFDSDFQGHAMYLTFYQDIYHGPMTIDEIKNCVNQGEKK